MDPVTIVSFAASIASVVLALVAIWLSVKFYQMTEVSAGKTTKAAEGIEATQEQLKELFDHLYADTFGLVRDTYSDMRSHAWGNPVGGDTTTALADDAIAKLKAEMYRKIEAVAARVGSTDDQVKKLTHELESSVGKAIAESRRVGMEAREVSLTQAVRSAWLTLEVDGFVTADRLVRAVADRGFQNMEVVAEITRLVESGFFVDPGQRIRPTTELRLTQAARTGDAIVRREPARKRPRATPDTS